MERESWLTLATHSTWPKTMEKRAFLTPRRRSDHSRKRSKSSPWGGGRGRGKPLPQGDRGYIDCLKQHQEEALNHPSPKGWWDYIYLYRIICEYIYIYSYRYFLIFNHLLLSLIYFKIIFQKSSYKKMSK